MHSSLGNKSETSKKKKCDLIVSGILGNAQQATYLDRLEAVADKQGKGSSYYMSGTRVNALVFLCLRRNHVQQISFNSYFIDEEIVA